MEQTLISIQAQRDVLMVIYQAVTDPQLVDDEEIYRLEGAIAAFTCSILTIKMMEGQ